MKLEHWNYRISDLSNYPSDIFGKELSVLANSVYAANYDLVKGLKPGSRLLEIGCGVESFVKERATNVEWHGIDVYKKDGKGRPTIATKIASVDELPYENNIFDYVLSNQSIEHWYEYDVLISKGLSEIARVLKVGGEAYINFPIHLHGQKEFVLGDFKIIDELFDKNVFSIADRVAYIDSRIDSYKGWRHCSFPDFFLKKNKPHESTSYVVEYVLEKISDRFDGNPGDISRHKVNINKRKSLFLRTLHYGLPVLAWRMANYVRKRVVRVF